MNSVTVSGISPNASLDDVKEFLHYCGKIMSITEISDGKCVVGFEEPASVQTAVLISGAIVVDAPVTITSNQEISRDMNTEESTSVVENMIDKGIIVGESIIETIKARIAELEQEGGIVSAVSATFNQARDKVEEVICGPKVVGNPTSESYLYGNQPQWGPPPSKQ